jgi:outer membrane protein assembly factor BamB
MWHAGAATSPSSRANTLPSDAAAAYQINPAHTGAQSGDPLTPGLARRWEVDLEGDVSYPLIAGGTVYVTVAFHPATLPAYTRLYALDLASGRSRWGPVDFSAGWAALTYDDGRLFVQLGNGDLKAIDTVSGAPLWTSRLPGVSGYSSPPSATGGTVYTAGAGYVDAVSESAGTLLWDTAVQGGDASSPAVTSSAVFVAYSCNQDYALNPASGAVIWHHAGTCEGGGGLTAVPANGRLYARDPVHQNLVLDAASGAELGTFIAGPAPAFDGSTGFFLDMSAASLPPADGGTLQARDASTDAVKWTFKGDGGLKSAPVVSGGYVYEGSSNGWLYALAEGTGQVAWSDRLSFGFTDPDVGQYPALAIGQGGLAAPFGSSLVFYSRAPVTAPSAQPTSGPDTAVAYQLDPQHSGGQSPDPLRLPARPLWRSSLQGTPSYPLIAGGHIYLTLSGSPTRLVALNAADGSAPWPAIDLSTSWALPAYDAGRIFTITAEGRLSAFDAATGTQLWQATLQQSSFHSPPTAANGSVYVSGRGSSNGTLFAVDEQTGALRWSQTVAGGDESAPLVTATGVYVSYTCPHVYDFDPAGGGLIWHYGSPSCMPDGGRSPVLFGGRLYVRDWHTGLVLDPATGDQLGVFQSRMAPAFSGSMAFYNNGGSEEFNGGRIEGWDLTTSSMVWRFEADDGAFAESAPVVVNGNLFEMLGGNLYAIDGKTGRQIWVGAVGAEPIAYEAGSGTVLGGIAAGGGYIAVPGGGQITVFGTGGSINPPTATAADESVSHQVNPVHSGGQPSDALTPPLTQKWSIELGGSVSYPLIAGGRVFVVVQPAGNAGPRLYALDRATGRPIWGPIPLSDVRGHAILAYDNGRVYVLAPAPSQVPASGSFLHAFDAANGTEMWSRGGPGNPVATQGQLFAGPRRFDEETGHQLWHPVTDNVDGFLDDVSQSGVYLTEGCEFAFDIAPSDGHIVWRHTGTQCTSGPSEESVLYGGRLYMHESVTSTQTILHASTGAAVGTYTSDTPPAFAGNLAYFMNGGTLEAHNLPGLGVAWTFAGDGGLVTAPVVVNGVVYVGSSSGTLYGLNSASGVLKWSGAVGAAMSRPDSIFADELTGFGAGEGTLVVPAGTRLVAYVSVAPSPTPSPTPTASPSPRTGASQSSPNPSIAPRNTVQVSPVPSPSPASDPSPSFTPRTRVSSTGF